MTPVRFAMQQKFCAMSRIQQYPPHAIRIRIMLIFLFGQIRAAVSSVIDERLRCVARGSASVLPT